MAINNSLMVGDFNNDGLDDLLVGESNGQGYQLISPLGAPRGSGINAFTIIRNF